MREPWLVQVLSDRWIVRERVSPVTESSFERDRLRILLSSGLEIQVDGSWKGTVGPPRTGAPIVLSQVSLAEGTRLASTVLFAAGAIRCILTGSFSFTADSADGSAHVAVRCPGLFAWNAEHGSVSGWIGPRAAG